MTNSSELGPREQLLKLQKETFARLEEEVHAKQGRESKDLRLFRKHYEKEVQDFKRIVTKAQLIEQVSESDLVYCGDYHTLKQAQRTVVRVLDPIASRGERKVALALEMVPKNAEMLANQYVEGTVKEEEFLEKIKYKIRWGFPWPHYKQLFDFARKYKLSIVGLGSPLSDRLPLEARDDLAADFIVEASLSDPTQLIFCLYGDLHIADSHIPKRVRMRMDRYEMKRKTLVIFQNSEAIYWKLAEAGEENTADVVEIGKNKYCVLSAAPWVKWQSYKTWLEDHTNLLDEPDEEGSGDDIRDYYHQVITLAQRIATFLSFKPVNLEQITVLTANDASVIEVLEKHSTRLERPNVPLRSLLRSEIVENQSCYLPENSILYLSDLSENRAAEKASQIVAAKLDSNPLGWIYAQARDEKEAFYRLVLWEAIGFFGSKIINPKRKCNQYKDFENFLAKTRRQHLKGAVRDEREVAIQLLAHRAYELRRLKTGKASGSPRKLYQLPPKQFFMAASHLGQILAQRLYKAMVKERVSMDAIRALYSPLPEDVKAGESRYASLIELIRHDSKENESKEDRF